MIRRLAYVSSHASESAPDPIGFLPLISPFDFAKSCSDGIILYQNGFSAATLSLRLR
ncbi:MAG: hypothetical protein ACI9HK_003823 [Pirellulaceae bacterium]|jgi:hypothetical protein